MSKIDFDFMISGAGLVGSLLALQLSKLNFKICLIESSDFEISLNEENLFNPLSLNYRSKIILEKYNIWSQISQYAHPINKLSIKHINNINVVSFGAEEINLDAMGYVVDRYRLLKIIRESVKLHGRISILENSKINNIERKNDHVCVQVDSDDGNRLLAKKIFISEGASSKFKQLVSEKSENIDYAQKSYFINCDCDFNENHAVQIFNKHGIFALIPYSAKSLNIVMSIKSDFSNLYFENNKPKTDNILDIFNQYVTNVKSLRFVNMHNLNTSRNDEFYKDRIFLLGNTFQILHPVGAQGYNFSLRNISSIVKYFANDVQSSQNMDSLIEEIMRDREQVITTVDFATKIFSSDKLFSKTLSKLFVESLKMSSKLRNSFLEKLLGIYEYPYLDTDEKL